MWQLESQHDISYSICSVSFELRMLFLISFTKRKLYPPLHFLSLPFSSPLEEKHKVIIHLGLLVFPPCALSFTHSTWYVPIQTSHLSPTSLSLNQSLSLPLVLFLRADAHTAPLCPWTCPPAHPKWVLCSLRSPLPPLLGSHPLWGSYLIANAPTPPLSHYRSDM